jgi:hypothetical protein
VKHGENEETMMDNSQKQSISRRAAMKLLYYSMVLTESLQKAIAD